MIQILDQEMYNLFTTMKRECHLWILTLILNAKNLKMEVKKPLKYGISIHWDFKH